MRFNFRLLLVIIACTNSSAGAFDGPVISSMDQLQFQIPKTKGQARLIEGKFGKAVQFQFAKDSQSTFFTSNIHGTPEWDKAAGFSFWVKGSSQPQIAALQFIYDNDYAVRYDYAFPVKSMDWTKISVAWQDLIPVLSGPNSKFLAIPGGNRPSKLSALWIGRWWYWSDYPALDFAIDEIRLEMKIDRDLQDYQSKDHPLQRTLNKVKLGQAITVVTMGDSLTDIRHWANRKTSWPNLLQQHMKQKYKTEVTIVNPAIGGTELRQNLVLMPRWLDKVPDPDLVTICFGGNDWNGGAREESFLQTCSEAVDRVHRATKGKADVLILTTVPGAEKWETMEELARAGRKAAQVRHAGLADTAQAFHEAGKRDRNRLYVADHVHLSPLGHKLIAETVLKSIESAGAN